MKKNKKRVFLTVIAILFLTFLIFLIVGYLSLDKEIDLSLVKQRESSITKIYYFDFDDRENRIGTPIELKEEAIFSQKSEWNYFYDFPPNLINAFIAIEDKRFYEHKGVDWLRTGNAILNYTFGSDKTSFGGSTITQQLIKNLTGDDKISVKRKAEEIFRALNLEKELSKNEILERYLNVIYLSQNCYGVGAASEVYFNKSVDELSLAECASLAAIVKNPRKYNPHLNKENNKERRNLVLKEMLSQGYITKNECDEAINEEIIINKNIENLAQSGVYSWYTEALISDVAKDISKEYGINYDAARMLILKGGMNIYSTIDPQLQKSAEEAYKSYKQSIKMQNGQYPESSCVIIDPKTSDVLALIGGAEKKQANIVLNRATTKRPLGSVIKPLSVYLPALEEGLITYSTIFDDTPAKMIDSSYWPKNSPNRYRGLMPASYAVIHSVNTVAVKALQQLGIEKSYDYLTNKFGLTLNEKNDKALAPLALGQLTDGESLLNVANAYTSFANGGYLSNLKTYLYVTDSNGNVIIKKENEKEKIFSKNSADIITKMLQGVVNEGTARAVFINENVDVAGKTGSSGENQDKWFIGYTPEYVCGVWVGFDNPKAINAITNPACIMFNNVMARVYEGVTKKICFDDSEGIVEVDFCKDSGMLATEECKSDIRGNRTMRGYFVKGSEPINECTLHKKVYIDLEDGYIANDSTPNWRKRTVSLIDYERKDIFYGVEILDSSYLIKNRKRK